MAVDESQLLGLVERIYAAASDPALWQEAVDALTAQFPGGRGMILHHDTGRGAGLFAVNSSNSDENWVAAYGHHYAALNPWMKSVMRRPVGLSVPAEFMFHRAGLLKTEFYQDYLRPQDLMSGIGVTLHNDRNLFIAASVLYPEQTAECETENVALLQRLAPHLRRALEVNRRLERANIHDRAAEAALERLAIGVVIVDDSARTVFHNKAAAEILEAQDGLKLDRHGAISAENSDETKWLHRAVLDSVQVLRNAAPCASSTARIMRPSGKTSYSVLVTPIKAGLDLATSRKGLAAILITDHDRGRAPPAKEIASLFGITQAEGRVLHLLAESHEAKDVARILNISELTVRTHIKNMLAKTDHSRQADLLRELAEHPIWILDHR
jgi:DNA-binding CsgD family transcriptional regulator/PAS domain-containing protein